LSGSDTQFSEMPKVYTLQIFKQELEEVH